MAPDLDVLCAADLCVDLIVTGDVRPRFGQVEQLVEDYALELGGSATIFACQFAKLGGRAGVLGALGSDAFGAFALERLRACGVDVARVRRDPGLKTGLGLALSEPHDRAILTYAGSIDALQPADLNDGLLRAARLWHLASFFLLTRLRPAWPAWLRRLREAGVRISLDTNWDPANRWEGVRELLPLVDVFLPNENEALAVSGEGDVRAAGAALARRCPLVVVKRGKDGAAAFQGPRRWEFPDPEPPRIVDTTGAGDNFDAGFLRAWLQERDLESCVRLGMRCGRASLAAAGGIAAQVRDAGG